MSRTKIQALSNKYFLVPTVRSLLITITWMRDSQMKLTKDFFRITNVLVVGAFCMLKINGACLHIKIYIQAKLSILQRRRGGGIEGEAVTVAFFAKTRPLKESLWWALQGDISIMGYDTAGENLNLNLALTLGYLNPALNNLALILSTNSHFFFPLLSWFRVMAWSILSVNGRTWSLLVTGWP